MNHLSLANLILRKLQDEISAEELQQLQDWIDQSPENQALYEELTDEQSIRKILLEELTVRDAVALSQETSDRIFQKILKQAPSAAVPARTIPFFRKRFFSLTLAAAFLGLIVWWAFPLFVQQEKKTLAAEGKTSLDFPKSSSVGAPAQEGAILTLSDGTAILLDSSIAQTEEAQQSLRAAQLSWSSNGLLAQKQDNDSDAGQTSIDKDAVSSKNRMAAQNKATVAYHTLTTPPGRQFQIQLADGTRVWLNAGSSIQFPTTFLNPQRAVALTGEAYFEVATNPAQPFRVYYTQFDQQQNNPPTGASFIEVTGTAFNVRSYKNDSKAVTTLVEGKVEVYHENLKAKLQPGQQAIANAAALKSSTSTNKKEGVEPQAGSSSRTYSNASSNTYSNAVLPPSALRVQKAQVDLEIAWKNGLFSFMDASLPEVMQQLERWYDVEVVLVQQEGGKTPRKFRGKIQRNLSLQEVLDIIREIGIQYELKGRKLYITNT